MDGFFLYLALLFAVILYTALIIIIYKHFVVDAKDPDAILHFFEKKDSVVGNFLLLLPIDEVRKKEHIIVEIQNSVQEASLEDVIDSVE